MDNGSPDRASSVSTTTGNTATVGRLPAPRADLSALSVAGELLVIGGGTASGPDPRVLATTDGVRFRTIARLALAVRYPAVATIGGLVYVVGGSTAAGDTRVIQSIDPRTGAVHVVGRLPEPISHASALVIGGHLLVAGGRFAGRPQDLVWRLDPARGTVVRLGRLPYAVSDAAPAVLGDMGYLIGGERRGSRSTRSSRCGSTETAPSRRPGCRPAPDLESATFGSSQAGGREHRLRSD